MKALLVFLVACGSEKTEQPAPKPTPEPMATTELVGCTNAPGPPRDPRTPRATPGVAPQVQPRVVVQSPAVAGDLDTGTVRTILRRYTTRFQYCFEKQLSVEPHLAGGTVEIGFAVQPTGRVASPRADGVHPEVSACVARALESVAFPAPIDQNQVQVTARIDMVYTPPGTPARGPAPRVLREWTPFAAEATASDDVAKPLVDATAAAVRTRLDAIERCFDDARGAIRAVIGFDVTGRSEAVRVGGIGDVGIERCIADALAGFTAPAPPVPVEVACDITRGGSAPLRVSPDAGYAVIELTPTHASHRMYVREVPARGTPPSGPSLSTTSAVLVAAEPDAPAHALAYALWWAPPGTTLVAVKASGGAPVFLGLGDGHAQRLAQADQRVLQLRTDDGRVRACIPGEALDATAPILDPKAMDRVLEAAAAACKRTACEPTIVVGTSGDFLAKELVATTSAARRAGFQAISIGGPACER